MTLSLDDVTVSTPPIGAATRARARSRFFVVLAAVLLTIVAVGFARSFYFRSWWLATHPALREPALPGYLILHGLLLTAWYVGFLVQTFLIASRRVRLHRTLGAISVGLAVGVLAMSALVVVRSVARSADGGVPASRLVPVVLGNFGTLVLFAGYFATGIIYRRRPDVHKRVMLLAAISLISPAIARVPGALTMFPVFILLPVLVMLVALIGYDLRYLRRVHPATAWAEVAYVAVVGGFLVASSTAFGLRIVEALR